MQTQETENSRYTFPTLKGLYKQLHVDLYPGNGKFTLLSVRYRVCRYTDDYTLMQIQETENSRYFPYVIRSAGILTTTR